MNKQVNPNLKTNNDTGFGNNPGTVGGRFINRDGSFNLKREGVPFFRRIGIYQRLLSLPQWKFVVVILAFYLIINLLFTGIYFMIGTNQLDGMKPHGPWGTFKEVFYFSTQTFTTVGYGRINPLGDAANIISSLEALAGLMCLAIATGLIFGRFAKPKAYLDFSDKALISPYKDGTALMFRFATYKDNHTLTNAVIKVNLAMLVEEKGKQTYKFYDLGLEREKVDNMPMNWTVVHAIDENSPLHGLTLEDLRAADAELYILVTAFDDVFSSSVLKRTSYTWREMQFNAKFIPMYRESEDGMTTILELHKLNHVKEMQTPRPDAKRN